MRVLSAILALSIALSPACATINLNQTEPSDGPAVAIIKKGKKAPFDGVLFNDEAYADQKSRHEDDLERAENRRKLDLAIQRNTLVTATATTKASLDASEFEKREVYKVKDDRIRSLEERLAKADDEAGGSAWWENALWFALGAAAVIFGGWSVGQAGK